MTAYNWNQIAEEKVNPLATRRMIHGEAMTVARRHFLKGAVTSLHLHRDEQISMVERGAVRFLAGGVEYVISANEALVIPSNVLHQLEALEDSFVTDIFATPLPKQPDEMKPSLRRL
jgi:quercetin dioxygenase-like cupin family protein